VLCDHIFVDFWITFRDLFLRVHLDCSTISAGGVKQAVQKSGHFWIMPKPRFGPALTMSPPEVEKGGQFSIDL
jgi:hypothetical protein